MEAVIWLIDLFLLAVLGWVLFVRMLGNMHDGPGPFGWFDKDHKGKK